MRTQITLRSSKDERGSRSLVANLDPAGDLVFEGQDLGRAVEEFWGEGNTEYEWKMTVPADQVTRAVEALGGSAKS
ncbi:MAG: hypothetical protein LC722_04025, partial [Actinobacteria bacterium]|nr:hypothetical protein [Actinomycetota bacterium]